MIISWLVCFKSNINEILLAANTVGSAIYSNIPFIVWCGHFDQVSNYLILMCLKLLSRDSRISIQWLALFLQYIYSKIYLFISFV